MPMPSSSGSSRIAYSPRPSSTCTPRIASKNRGGAAWSKFSGPSSSRAEWLKMFRTSAASSFQ
jgi:hypothetical protein